jgi:hypothetical protein
MGEVIDLDEFRRRKLSKQFDNVSKKTKKKQNIRERRENELDESEMRHPSYQNQPVRYQKKKKFEDD